MISRSQITKMGEGVAVVLCHQLDQPHKKKAKRFGQALDQVQTLDLGCQGEVLAEILEHAGRVVPIHLSPTWTRAGKKVFCYLFKHPLGNLISWDSVDRIGEKDVIISDLRETVEILQLKVQKLEQLLRFLS